MDAPPSKLEQYADQDILANRPFPVQDPDSVWIVDSGKLDLFLVSGAGARFHVMRVEEGQAIFGFGFNLDSDTQLIAVSNPGTKVHRVPHASLLGEGGQTERDGVLGLLEDWIYRLSSAIFPAIGPRTFLLLESGSVVKIEEESTVVLPKESILWVAHQKGCSYFLGKRDLAPIEGQRLFPISQYGWLETIPGSTLDVVDTVTMQRLDPEWHAVREFHRIAICCMLLNRSELEKQDKNRLRVKAESDAALLDNALRQLASPAEELKVRPDLDPDIANHPLLLVCQAVGDRLGVKIKPQPDIFRRTTSNDLLSSVARTSGLSMRRVALKGEWWRYDSGPLVAFLESDATPVALLPRSADGYDLYDPVRTKTIKVNRDAAASVDPFAYSLYRPFPAQALRALDLIKFGIRGCKPEISTILFMGIATAILSMLLPYATGIAFDSFIPGAQRKQLFQTAALLVIAAIASAIFFLTGSFAVLRLEGKMDAAVQAAMWDRLLRLPVSFFRNYSSGDLALRSLGIVQIRQALTGSTITSILSGIFSVFSFGLLFYYSWRLAILATMLVAFAFVTSTAFGFFQVQHQRHIVELHGRIAGTVLQFITGIAKLKVSGTEARAFAVWARAFSKQRQRSIAARKVSNGLTVFISVFPAICLGIIFYYHAYLMRQPHVPSLTTGSFLAFVVAFMQFMAASLQLSSSVVSVANVVPIYQRALPILRSLPETSSAKSSPGILSGSIELSHVTFRYKSDAPLVLRDISISIEPGQFVAIVGASGCGKSTIFRLLLGFEIPESGTVYYDGFDLTGLDLQALRRQIGVVLQSSTLVSGDIFTNIVGSSSASMEDAWAAARLAGVEEDIRRMPMGMYTMISTAGSDISGGQRQRLMIARAIISKPRIILFDEATSALDNRTQAVVSHSLEALRATRVVIAHRISTVRHADRIVVLEMGRIVQSGTYEELMEQPGLFRELAARQLT